MWLFMVGADPQGPMFKLGWIGDDVLEAILQERDCTCISTSSNDINGEYDVAVLATALPAGWCITKYLRYMTNKLMHQIEIVQIRYIRHATRVVYLE
jgi:hypothetical protein